MKTLWPHLGFSKSRKGDNLVKMQWQGDDPYSECCPCDGKQICEVWWEKLQQYGSNGHVSVFPKVNKGR